MSEPNKRVSWLLERQKPGPSEHLSAGIFDSVRRHVQTRKQQTNIHLQKSAEKRVTIS